MVGLAIVLEQQDFKTETIKLNNNNNNINNNNIYTKYRHELKSNKFLL